MHWPSFEFGFATAIASLFSWVAYALVKIQRKTMTWTFMLVCIPLSLVVGYCTGELLHYFVPQWPESVCCCISSILGSSCTFVIDRITLFGERAADRLEGKILNEIGEDHKKSEPPKE